MVSFTLWCLYFGERTPVLNAKEAGWTPEPIWTLGRREELSNPDSLVTQPLLQAL
jgi:hypothetical protein